jgi:hypothetical protein
MLLFAFWAALTIAGLGAAGYSHYRYRVRNNQYYEYLFAKRPDERMPEHGVTSPIYSRDAVPAFTLAIVCLLVCMALAI